jgi:hypothetical protein
MSELLQEFVDSGQQRLRVDRAAGVIRGVKLLGLSSRNGRRYRESALIEAVGLYEGAKVNINHPKGHPLSPRDYQDRLGVVRGVAFRAGDGLFGDLHFNPKHALSEQLVWDAEHAPQNVGMSHNVLARTTRSGEDTVVEAITKVQSIDLVADPATTSGLYEYIESQGSSVEGQAPQAAIDSPALNSRLLTLDVLTLEQLREHRPELIAELEQPYETQLEQVRKRLDEVLAHEQVAQRRKRIAQLLEQHELPASAGDDNRLVSQEFMDTLMGARDDAALRQLIEERAALVRSACDWSEQRHRPTARRPLSRHQLESPLTPSGVPLRSAAEFAKALTG